jgi:peptidyl-prolyl cis-trans isomerase A (cyclophilin A)
MRLLCACLLVSACDAGAPPVVPAPPSVISVAVPLEPDSGDPRPPIRADLARYLAAFPGQGTLVATLETSEGTIHCDLLPDRAPLAVANFIGLATGRKAWRDPKSGAVQRGIPFYDGLTFHRVIPEFMIQGGDPLARGAGGPGYQFVNEIVETAKMGPGALAMANAGPDTNGSQFFIMDNDARPDLVTHHTIYGQCHELDIVQRIARVPRGPDDKPTHPVTIEHVSFARGSDPWRL